MYFWRIRKLKQSLMDSALSGKAALQYLLAHTIFYLGFTFLFSLAARFATRPGWIMTYILTFFIIQLFGIYYCYHSNGATKGRDFLARYMALFWVGMVRFVVFGLILVILGVFIVEVFVGQQVLMTPHFKFMGLFWLVWIAAFYVRMGAHFCYLQRQNIPS